MELVNSKLKEKIKNIESISKEDDTTDLEFNLNLNGLESGSNHSKVCLTLYTASFLEIIMYNGY